MSITDTVNFGLLRHSITRSRDFSCPRCRHVLDVNDAVMLTVHVLVRDRVKQLPWDLSDRREQCLTLCADCTPKALNRLKDTLGNDTHDVRIKRMELVDGRAYTKQGQLRARPPKEVEALAQLVKVLFVDPDPAEELAREVQGNKA